MPVFAINAANRDPAVYPDPHTFDITRRARPLAAFGQGPHSCIGNWLAFTELTTALRLLLKRLPDLRLVPEAADEVRITSQDVIALRGPNTLPVLFDRCAPRLFQRSRIARSEMTRLVRLQIAPGRKADAGVRCGARVS